MVMGLVNIFLALAPSIVQGIRKGNTVGKSSWLLMAGFTEARVQVFRGH